MDTVGAAVVPFSQGREKMSTVIEELMEKFSSPNDEIRYPAFQEMQRITEEKVDWFPRYKDQLMAKLASENSFQRNIGIVLLCNLAKNDTNREYDTILDALMPKIDDEKFITQRQYLQNIWKVAIVNPGYEERIIQQLEKEFRACAHKDHYNLLRTDIIVSLRNIMKVCQKEGLKSSIDELISSEADEKNRKKYRKTLGGEEKSDSVAHL